MTLGTDSHICPARRRALDGVQRVVVKIGSAVIAARGRLQLDVIAHLAEDVAQLKQSGLEVLMVISGAVAGGYAALGRSRPPRAVVERQAAACIGQPKLMAAFSRAFAAHDIEIAQLLMMEDDITHRRRFLSARHAVQALIRRGIVPIINENDPLADDESKIGDNDHLAALVTNVASAEWLIILSQVDGVRRDGGSGAVIDRVDLDSSIAEHISRQMSASGVGGMAAKVSAAHLASHWGVPTVIANGRTPGMLQRLLAGEPLGTFFTPRESKLSLRKRWIAFRTKSSGTLRVDAGAKQAITHQRAALLPGGVVEVEGRFSMGARVDVCDEAGHTFAVGLVSYAAPEIRQMRGRKPSEFKAVLGYEYVPEVIDREDLVCLVNGEA